MYIYIYICISYSDFYTLTLVTMIIDAIAENIVIAAVIKVRLHDSAGLRAAAHERGGLSRGNRGGLKDLSLFEKASSSMSFPWDNRSSPQRLTLLAASRAALQKAGAARAVVSGRRQISASRCSAN